MITAAEQLANRARSVGHMNPPEASPVGTGKRGSPVLDEARKTARIYPSTISMLAFTPPAQLLPIIGNGSAYLEEIDAVNECPHGRLVTDSPESRAKAGCTCHDRSES